MNDDDKNTQEWESLIGIIVTVGGEFDEETNLWLAKVGAKKMLPPGPVEPEYPRDATLLTTEELGQLFDTIGNWQDFYQTESTSLRGVVQRAKEALNVTEAFLLTKILSGPMTSKEKEVRVRPEYVQLLAHYLRTKHMHQTAIASLNRFSSMLRRLSRHVAMRTPQLAGLFSGLGGYGSGSYGSGGSGGSGEDDHDEPSPKKSGRLPRPPGYSRGDD